MKTIFVAPLFTLVLYSALSVQSPAWAGGESNPTPACSESKTVYPCLMPTDEASSELINMIVENKKGLALVNKTGVYGLVVDPDSVKMTLISERKISNDGVKHHGHQTVAKIEVELTDSRGSDQVLGHYVWTVNETTNSDGYSYKTEYLNNLVKK